MHILQTLWEKCSSQAFTHVLEGSVDATSGYHIFMITNATSFFLIPDDNFRWILLGLKTMQLL